MEKRYACADRAKRHGMEDLRVTLSSPSLLHLMNNLAASHFIQPDRVLQQNLCQRLHSHHHQIRIPTFQMHP
jgi:hypothetical protein